MAACSDQALGRVKPLWRKHRCVAISARWPCGPFFGFSHSCRLVATDVNCSRLWRFCNSRRMHVCKDYVLPRRHVPRVRDLGDGFSVQSDRRASGQSAKIAHRAIYRPIRGASVSYFWFMVGTSLLANGLLRGRNQCGAAATGMRFSSPWAHKAPSVACQATGIKSK